MKVYKYPKRICKHCKKEYQKQGKFYCSYQCNRLDKPVITMKGNKHWNWKGGKVKKQCRTCGKDFFVSLYMKNKAVICSHRCRIPPPERCERIRNTLLKIHGTYEVGGISPKHHRIRKSLKYRQWREAVFRRDNFTCQECHQKGGYLQADHIKPFSIFIKLRFEIKNGRTLCLKCHRRTDTYGSKMKNYAKNNNI